MKSVMRGNVRCEECDMYMGNMTMMTFLCLSGFPSPFPLLMATWSNLFELKTLPFPVSPPPAKNSPFF